MKKTVRMADIAQQLGISTVSVSKALAGKPGVSIETRDKVIAMARQMGYDNIQDKHTSGRTGNIGVLVSDHNFSGNAFYTRLYRELVLKSRAEGFSCITEIVPKEAEQSKNPSYLVMDHRVDGIIFMGEINRTYLTATAATGLPCLLVDFCIPDLQLDYVIRDNEGGGYLLTQHLLSAGYKRIGFVGDPDHSVNDMFHYLGYQWALREAGIIPPEMWLWGIPDRVPDLSSSCDDIPEAFVCSNSEVAVELCRLIPPVSIAEGALACFEDLAPSACSQMLSATYLVEANRIAEDAICQLVRKIRRESGVPVGCITAGHLSER